MRERELELRPRGKGNCAYCRDSLGVIDDLVRCDDCDVALHQDCRDELRGCPTLGCAGLLVSATDDEWRRWNEQMARYGHGADTARAGWLQFVNPGYLIAAALLLLMVVVIWLLGRPPGG